MNTILRANVHDPPGSGCEAASKRAHVAPIERVSVHSHTCPLNLAVGWCGIAAGLVAALWIGAWAFAGPVPPPAGFEAYDALPRRLLRLAHIAAVAVGALNVLFARELPRLGLPAAWKRAASVLAAASWPALVLALGTAAFVPAARYALPGGALALTAAAGIAAAAAVRAAIRRNSS
jgi:hypothetical protein